LLCKKNVIVLQLLLTLLFSIKFTRSILTIQMFLFWRDIVYRQLKGSSLRSGHKTGILFKWILLCYTMVRCKWIIIMILCLPSLVSLFKSFLFPNAFRKRINGFSQLFFIVDYKNVWSYLNPGTGNHWFDYKLTFSRFHHYLSTKCNSYLHVQHCLAHNSETMAPW